MISIQEALNIVLKKDYSVDSEIINFVDSLHRVLAEDVFSDINMPPFNKSAMDGFACRMLDINNELELIETIPAGKIPKKTVGVNQCSKIMTGAPIPEGADCVIMVEDTKILNNGNILFLKDKTKDNICYLGEDITENQKVLSKGTLIRPQHIAIMASVGKTKVLVAKKPKIGIIATGSEIVEPGNVPNQSQIRNSNAYQLISQVKSLAAIPNYLGIAIDSEEDTYQKIKKGLEETDLLLLTGGVSMGDFDFVPKIMQKAGVEILFDKIAVQPGKPTTFGIHKKASIFGLPGNPVSSFVQFELLVKPLIYKMMGCNSALPELFLPMKNRYERKRSERESWFPVIINSEGFVETLDYNGSAHINGLGPANAICRIELGKNCIEQGERVYVRPI
ncbi:MAG: molybdopterin molybdotransferase MoeA [Bacteroidales bacterium]|nr:molybdopterin molybdotransferase MoeA [Bacteroidales bacterium]